MADFIHRTDPYDHLIVVHTFPDQQDKVYRPLLGDQSALRGASLQNSNVADCHRQVVKWVRESAKAGAPWVVAFDEPGTAAEGMPPDPGYPGTPENFDNPSIHQVRQQVLWGTLLAGGGGVEYYFGYRLPQNDLVCEDWRSRDQSWDYCRIALDFFRDEKIPFHEMANADALVGNPDHGNERYCFAKEGEIYLVYLPAGGAAELDLSGASGEFRVGWFDPRQGGALQPAASVKGGATAKLVAPSKGAGDWLAVVRRAER
ncbi:MAG: putative collagen-binding domain-containing protein [Verrucomicrobiales bacterium]